MTEAAVDAIAALGQLALAVLVLLGALAAPSGPDRNRPPVRPPAGR
jgi:hypothetical protein